MKNLCGLTLGLFAACAQAHTQLELFAAGETGTPVFSDSFSMLDPGSAPLSKTLAFAGSSVAAAADLRFGTLTASAAAHNDAIGLASSAQAIFSDSLDFSSGVGMTGYLYYSFHGRIDLEPDPKSVAATYGYMSFGWGGSTGPGSTYTLAMAQPGICDRLLSAMMSLGCQEAPEVTRSGVISFEIQPTVYFNMALGAVAAAGSVVDLSNTGRFFLVVPQGASFTSASGHFLTSAAPIPAVPEPPVWMMLTAACCVGAIVRRGRRPV